MKKALLLLAAIALAATTMTTDASARKRVQQAPVSTEQGDDHRYPGTAGASFSGGNWGFASSGIKGSVAGRDAWVPNANERCGYNMRQMFGGRYGAEYNRALAWLNAGPRVQLQPGAVVVSYRGGRGKGHVVKVVSVIDKCNAMVEDGRGVYQRNTCKARAGIVMPS